MRKANILAVEPPQACTARLANTIALIFLQRNASEPALHLNDAKHTKKISTCKKRSLELFRDETASAHGGKTRTGLESPQTPQHGNEQRLQVF
jgi:hypothetical protein